MPVAFTPTLSKVYVVGDRKEVIVDLACAGNPTVGGDDLTAAALGLDEINSVDPCGGASNAGGTSGAGVGIIHEPGGDKSKVKVVFYVQAVAAAGTSMVAYTGATAGFVFRARVVGKGKAATAP